MKVVTFFYACMAIFAIPSIVFAYSYRKEFQQLKSENQSVISYLKEQIKQKSLKVILYALFSGMSLLFCLLGLATLIFIFVNKQGV